MQRRPRHGVVLATTEDTAAAVLPPNGVQSAGYADLLRCLAAEYRSLEDENAELRLRLAYLGEAEPARVEAKACSVASLGIDVEQMRRPSLSFVCEVEHGAGPPGTGNGHDGGAVLPIVPGDGLKEAPSSTMASEADVERRQPSQETVGLDILSGSDIEQAEQVEVEQRPVPAAQHSLKRSNTVNSENYSEFNAPLDSGTPWKPVFANADDMKEQVRQKLHKKQYNVTDYYKDSGCFQMVARSPWFDTVTLSIIFINTIWIAIDTDINSSSSHSSTAVATDVDAESDLLILFFAIEQVFCTLFFIEIVIRFCAFRDKKYCLYDHWFIFDTGLVMFFVVESWIMPLLLLVVTMGSDGGSLGKSSVLRGARLLRLTRMARITRLLRRMPELMILLKGMMAACRSVLFTLMLLFVVTYVHAIAFTQLLEGTEVGRTMFHSVFRSMHTLWVYGALVDECSHLMTRLEAESWFCVGVFYLYILVAALTVMNMLIGVLCDVVGAVGEAEKEELALNYAKNKLGKIYTLIKGVDVDAQFDGLNVTMCKADFVKMLDSTECCHVVNDLGVDVVGLVDFADIIFSHNIHDTEYDRELTFAEFLDIVTQLRGSNTATVKDVVDIRKFVGQAIASQQSHLDKVAEQTRLQYLSMAKKLNSLLGVAPPEKCAVENKEMARSRKARPPSKVTGSTICALPSRADFRRLASMASLANDNGQLTPTGQMTPTRIPHEPATSPKRTISKDSLTSLPHATVAHNAHNGSNGEKLNGETLHLAVPRDHDLPVGENVLRPPESEKTVFFAKPLSGQRIDSPS
eukprot:TRINITY_DN18312_c0_g3_i1.p1 TRINITY_DN18312_c0_g3~~TRINITY_DN18312_c0_g3_i1.p1  ORF type:complete len:803 (-),score=138.08 TRINITY_DN18312_c0_g3_i1:56-2464(-)